MARTVLFSFNDEDTREYFLKFIEQQSKKQSVIGKICSNILPSMSKDPQVRAAKDKFVALFVAGSKIAEGGLAEITKKFNSEIHAHSANVQIKEFLDGKWVTLRRRLAS